MQATIRGRPDAENRLAFGSRICATGENVATSLTLGFEGCVAKKAWRKNALSTIFCNRFC